MRFPVDVNSRRRAFVASPRGNVITGRTLTSDQRAVNTRGRRRRYRAVELRRYQYLIFLSRNWNMRVIVPN
jgi:hypothetical protein